MSDIDRLIKAMAFDRAYAIAHDHGCVVCGRPACFLNQAVRPAIPMEFVCANHFKQDAGGQVLPNAAAVTRLMRIVDGE